MNILYLRIDATDVIVFATPGYIDGVTGPMKNLMDRIIPRAQPFFELRDDHCRHPVRGEAKVRKFVLVSNCGFWEKDNFDPLIVHMKAICKNLSAEFSGALLHLHGEAIAEMLEMGAQIGDIFEAAKEAGCQLVKEEKISQETLDIVSRELLPRDTYIQIDQHAQQTLEALEKC